jgi:hypothetical protein
MTKKEVSTAATESTGRQWPTFLSARKPFSRSFFTFDAVFILWACAPVALIGNFTHFITKVRGFPCFYFCLHSELRLVRILVCFDLGLLASFFSLTTAYGSTELNLGGKITATASFLAIAFFLLLWSQVFEDHRSTPLRNRVQRAPALRQERSRRSSNRRHEQAS